MSRAIAERVLLGIVIVYYVKGLIMVEFHVDYESKRSYAAIAGTMVLGLFKTQAMIVLKVESF